MIKICCLNTQRIINKTIIFKNVFLNLGMVEHTYNPRFWEGLNV